MTSKPHSEHIAAFKAWALAEKASPYAEWRIDRAQARYLFEQLEFPPRPYGMTWTEYALRYGWVSG